MSAENCSTVKWDENKESAPLSYVKCVTSLIMGQGGKRLFNDKSDFLIV